MVKIYNKLVRDRIPKIIENSGAECKIKILSDDEYLKMIDAKLDEELLEYHSVISYVALFLSVGMNDFYRVNVNVNHSSVGGLKRLFEVLCALAESVCTVYHIISGVFLSA